MAEAAQAPSKRPLSPHLQVYRLTLSMIMSGVHRITGLSLVPGMVMLTGGCSPPRRTERLRDFEAFSTTWFGRLVLFGFSWARLPDRRPALLVWDLGIWIENEERSG
jgi:succinate dehydrogenase / fumarate reductase cytochrome b subunit